MVEVGSAQFCQVEYDRGGTEWLTLEQQHFRVLGPRASSAGCTPAVKVAALLDLIEICPVIATST